jgi:type II secretory pathway pseudopilin PulG
MSVRTRSRSRPAGKIRRRGRAAGFSVLGLSLVFLLVSVLASFAVPALQQAVRAARAKAVADDLRGFAAAFQAYARQHGDWPPAGTESGAVPPGMAGPLGSTHWQRATPLGGRYTWAPNTLQRGERYRAAIMLASTAAAAVSADRQQLLELDRAIDDGDLATGAFRLGYRNFPVYVLEH